MAPDWNRTSNTQYDLALGLFSGGKTVVWFFSPAWDNHVQGVALTNFFLFLDTLGFTPSPCKP